MRLIDADKLRKDVLDLPNCYNGFSDTYDKAIIIDLVDEQPTVKAEPIKHWKWLTNIHRRTVCSECGFRPETKTDYCPSCGAKMDEVDE